MSVNSVHRTFNTENTDSIIQRKPGNQALQIRKPFLDRAVNCNTPDINRKVKPNEPVKLIKETIKNKSPTVQDEELVIPADAFCSYKQFEDDFDIMHNYFRVSDVKTVLKNFCNPPTPPPSPSIPMEPYNVSSGDLSLYSSFENEPSFDKWQDIDMVVPLPELNFDEFM